MRPIFVNKQENILLNYNSNERKNEKSLLDGLMRFNTASANSSIFDFVETIVMQDLSGASAAKSLDVLSAKIEAFICYGFQEELNGNS